MGLDDMYSGGAPSCKFPTVGTTYEGRVVAVRDMQGKVYGTETLETWRNGDPRMTTIITIETGKYDDEDDSGNRDVWCRSGIYTAVQKAIREAWTTKPADINKAIIGANLKIRFTEEVPGKGNPRKVYVCRITPAVQSGGLDDAGEKAEADSDPAPPPDDSIPF